MSNDDERRAVEVKMASLDTLAEGQVILAILGKAIWSRVSDKAASRAADALGLIAGRMAYLEQIAGVAKLVSSRWEEFGKTPTPERAEEFGKFLGYTMASLRAVLNDPVEFVVDAEGVRYAEICAEAMRLRFSGDHEAADRLIDGYNASMEAETAIRWRDAARKLPL